MAIQVSESHVHGETVFKASGLTKVYDMGEVQIHALRGIELELYAGELVAFLGAWGKIPVTYAGGAASLDDLEKVDTLSGGAVDLTIGSALDIFGGSGARYEDCVAWNRRTA